MKLTSTFSIEKCKSNKPKRLQNHPFQTEMSNKKFKYLNITTECLHKLIMN